MIETKRLTSRKLTKDDIETWLEFLQGEDSLQFLPFSGPTHEDSRKWIEKQMDRYKKNGYGMMALIHKETGEMVGQCGILVQDIEGKIETEVAYHIIPRFRGQGYATEAAVSFKEYIFEKGISDSVISLIHVDNVKSQRVADKNGMKRDFITKRLSYMDGIPLYVYRINREEFDGFQNAYNNKIRAASYAMLEFPNTYYLAFRDVPAILKDHVTGIKALDFGCGTGRSTRFLKDQGLDTTGIDIASDMLKIARQKDPEGAYILVKDGDYAQLPEVYFDLVFAAFTFDNIPDHKKRIRILSELKELLSKNGRIILMDSSPELYVNECASFSTKDFPGNSKAKSGEIVKVIMNDVEDKRPVEDVIWFEEDYLDLFDKSGLELLRSYRPLAYDDEPYEWECETDIAPWVIYVLKK